jgi:hypothetical protein
MSKSAAAILADAMHLPDEERRALALELVASVGDDPAVLEAWADVAEQRAGEVSRSEAHAVPWSEARAANFGDK